MPSLSHSSTSEPAMAPRIEPWSPDSDPWGAAWTVPPVVEAPVDGEPVAADDVGAERAVDEPVAEEQIAEEQVAEEPAAEEHEVRAEEPVVAAALAEDGCRGAGRRGTRGPRRGAQSSRRRSWTTPMSRSKRSRSPMSPASPAKSASSSPSSAPTLPWRQARPTSWRAPEPDVEPEPLIESDSRDDEPTIADAAIAAMVAGAAVEGAIDEEPAPAQDDSQDDGPTFADAAMAATAASVGWRRDSPGAPVRGAVHWGRRGRRMPSPRSQRSSTASRARASLPATGLGTGAWARAGRCGVDRRGGRVRRCRSGAGARSPPGRRTFGRSQSQTQQPAPPPELAALVAAGQPVDADLDSADDDDSRLPEAAIAAAAIAASEPEIEARRPDVPWLDRPDQTEVYPTTWEPPARPAPAARCGSGQRRASHRGDSHDARSGRARPGRRARRGADDGRGGRAVADRRDPAARRHGDRATGPDLCRRCVPRRWRGRLTDAIGGRFRRRARPERRTRRAPLRGPARRHRRIHRAARMRCPSTATSR